MMIMDIVPLWDSFINNDGREFFRQLDKIPFPDRLTLADSANDFAIILRRINKETYGYMKEKLDETTETFQS